MQRVDTEIPIVASQRDVWTVLSDFGEYANWNPWIQEARGDAMVGRNLSLSFNSAGKVHHYWGKITRSEAPEVLRWWMPLLPFGLLRAEIRFRVRLRSSGGSMLHHSAVFSGPLEPLLSSRLREAFTNGAVASNQALKRRVEKFSNGLIF